MNQNLLAKSNPKETITEHTEKVINEYIDLLKRDFFRHIDKKYYDYIKKILYYHDFGKVSPAFQNIIYKKINEQPFILSTLDYIYHEWLSSSFVVDEDRVFFKNIDTIDSIDFLYLAFYILAYHHDRNAIAKSEDIKAHVQEINDNINILDLNGPVKPVLKIDAIKRAIESREYWPAYFPYVVYFKGILHKCDYAASAHVKAEQKYTGGNYQSHFTDGLKKKGITELYDYQQQAAELADKNIIFIASTGAGKTEYSMNWINGNKAFYLLGLRTAVNAMYDRFKAMFAFDKEHENNVGLLHGESIYRLLDDSTGYSDYEEDEDILKQHTKIRQLSMPLTVATADQLVPSVFKFPGFEFYYFTASYSKIVIDEIQSFAPEAIASIVVFLKEIQRLGGKFLLMTATLPPFVLSEFDELEQSGTLVKQKYYSTTKRHVIKCMDNPVSGESSEKIIDEALKANKKVLVISNTVAGAQELADRLGQFNPELLHSRFIRKDRKEKEEKIFAETDYVNHPDNKNKPCLWISTQIVEASLDIDFDLLLTENATIDALFQRFGRCWRKREYDSAEPNIFIFKHDDISYKIYDRQLIDKTWEVLHKYSGSLILEETKQAIIEEVFSDIENTKYFKDYKKYKDMLVLGMRATGRDDAITMFRKINNNYTVIPEPVFNDDKNRQVIEKLFVDIENRNIDVKERYKLKNELFGYTVPVQIMGKRKELLKDIYIDGKRMQRLDIHLLKGVTYTGEKGVEFIKEYKDMDNYVF